MPTDPLAPDVPEWANRIRQLRTRLKLGQVEFAQTLQLSQKTVSLWEAGKKEPSPESYKKLVVLASADEVNDEELSQYFLARMESRVPWISELVEEARRRQKERTPRELRIDVMLAHGTTKPENSSELKKYPDAVAVPLLRDAAAIASARHIKEAAVEETILLSCRQCPHPESTVCIRVAGDAMSPLLEEGYVAAIDTAVSDPVVLVNQIVATSDAEGTVAVRWLRRSGSDLLLVPQQAGVRHRVEVLRPGWKIVGKVEAWIGAPPKA